MGTLALSLVLASVFLHIGWNLVAKGLKPGAAFMCCVAGGGALLALPAPLILHAHLTEVPAAVWALIVLTGMAQTWYFLSLSAAYRHGDFSVAYPLARALPVFLVAAISATLHWGRPLSALAAGGMACVVAGCLMLPLRTFSTWRALWHDRRGSAFAVLAALGTTCYTLIDYRALGLLGREVPHVPHFEGVVLYAGLEALVSFAFTAAAVLAYRPWRERLAAMTAREVRIGMGAGMAMVSAYGLILAALSVAEQVSLVVALRQLSLPLGALIGIRFFNEAASMPRRAGIAVTTLGLVIVAWP